MNRKIILTLLTCATSLYAVAGLTACNSHKHSYTAEVTEPTCTEGGYTTHTCACGDSYTDGETQPLGHDYVNTVTPPTCTEGGYTTHTCDCGDSYTDEQTQPLGHDYTVSWNWVGYSSATATFTCSRNNKHTETINGEISSTVTTTPDCTTEGVKTYTATVTLDGKQYTDKSDEILPITHNLVNNVCTDCGYTAVESQGLDMILDTDTNTYSVSGIGTCTDSEIVIPSTYNGKPVTAIEDYAFNGCNITSITIGNNVTKVKNNAFNACLNLTEITFSNSIQSFYPYSFSSCDKLTEIKYEGSISEWCSISGLQFLLVNSNESEKNLYINGTKVEGEIVIPTEVSTIASYAFSHINGLTSVKIASGVRLGNSSFKYCSSLTSVTLDKDIDSIGSNVFVYCDNLKTINYNGTVEQWNNIVKGTNWHGSLSGLTVICADGKLDKDGNPIT